jgi:S-adenosylmethionine decarboxylase
LYPASSEITLGNKISPISGLHIVSNFTSHKDDALSSSYAFKRFIDSLIQKYQLTNVGEAYHQFENGGFTAVVCLTESHLSIHTWPEKNYVTFDIFLSNFLKDNRETTRQLYASVISFFDARILFEQSIER